jgi:hypothetical protein
MTRTFPLLAALISCACSTHTLELTEARNDAGSDAGVMLDDAAEPRDADAGLVFDDAGAVMCGGHVCACSNGDDDDGDDLIDGFDPECSAAYDDDERSFGTGVNGENGSAKRRDCFYDGNAGRDDGCDVPASCLDTGASDEASCGTCCAGEACRTSCLPRAPNGCDCFGCCEVRGAAGSLAVLLRDSCSVASLADPDACPRCALNRTCFNPCGECELCPGKAAADLPARCAASGGFACDEGTRCGDDRGCAVGFYCALGCCVPPLL